jgi:hypothetical protein
MALAFVMKFFHKYGLTLAYLLAFFPQRKIFYIKGVELLTHVASNSDML